MILIKNFFDNLKNYYFQVCIIYFLQKRISTPSMKIFLYFASILLYLWGFLGGFDNNWGRNLMLFHLCEDFYELYLANSLLYFYGGFLGGFGIYWIVELSEKTKRA